MNWKMACLLGLLVSLSTFLPSAVRAGSVPAIGFTSINSADQHNNGNWSLGWEFTTNATINVTALGFYDATLTGGSVGLGNCDGCGEVGIYNSTGTLLVSGMATTLGTLVGDFYYVSVPTTTLAAGQNFFIVAETENAEYTWFTNGFNVNSDITYLTDSYVRSATLAFPTLSDGYTAAQGGGFFGPNFEFGSATTTPEPSSILLLGSSLLAAAGIMKRKILS